MTVGDVAAREIVVETSKVRAVFSNRGAAIVHWILKEFRNDAGEPLDLVPGGAGSDTIKPFTLTVDDQAISARMKDAIYRVTVNGNAVADTVDATASPQTIVFEAAGSDGFNVRKAFTLEPTSYVIGVTASVQSGQQQLNPTIHWGPGLGDDIARTPPASFFSPAYTLPAQAIVYRDGDVDRMDPRRQRRRRKGRSGTPASTIIISRRILLNDAARNLRDRLSAAARAARERSADHRQVRQPTRCDSRQPQAIAAFLLWTEGVRGAARDRSGADARDQLRHVLVAGGAAARRA